MNNLTLLETILIIYILVSTILAVISIITRKYASRKVSDTIYIIWLGFAVPIMLPTVIYVLIFHIWKKRND